MGIVAASAKALLDARVLRGVDFTRTMTMGHQQLNLFPSEARRFQAATRELLPATADPRVSLAWGDYADDFLRAYLGVETLDIVDNSDFEHAGLVHDLNVPVPAEWEERYDAIIDGGLLEHVFNVPVVLESYTRMLKLGGTAFLFIPANNFCGHGLYQFSPELIFRWFSRRNGFELQPPVLVRHGVRLGFSITPVCYEVTDPAVVHERVELSGGSRTDMLIEARRVARVRIDPPQQSDYVEKWSAAASGEPGPARPPRAGPIKAALRAAYGRLPLYAQILVQEYVWRYRKSLSNRRHYRRLPYLDFSPYPSRWP